MQAAYDVLSDSKKRQMYDQYGFYSESGYPGAAGGAHPQEGGPEVHFGGFDFSDIFSKAGSGGFKPGPGAGQGRDSSSKFGDIFGQFFSRGGDAGHDAASRAGFGPGVRAGRGFLGRGEGDAGAAQYPAPGRLRNLQGHGLGGRRQHGLPAVQRVGQRDAAGGHDEVRPDVSAVRGHGADQECVRNLSRGRPGCGHRHCGSAAAGGGAVRRPAARGGQRERGNPGAPPGDLYITVRVQPHEFFEREGDDVHIQVPVTVWEAALGTKIEVPTIEGRSLLKIPQGTQNGQKFRLRGKGIFNARKNRHGDMIVEVEVQAPKANDERTREMLKELSALHPEDPRASIWEKV